MSPQPYLIPRQVTTRLEFLPGFGLRELVAVLIGTAIAFLGYQFLSLVRAPGMARALIAAVPPVAAYFLVVGGEQSLAVLQLRAQAYRSRQQRFLYATGTGGGASLTERIHVPRLLAPVWAFLPSPLKVVLSGLFAAVPARRGDGGRPAISATVQGWYPVAHVEGGLMVRRDGALVAAVQVQPVNFSLRSEAERARIIAALHEAINALQQPAQILALPRPVDLDGYIRSLEAKLRDTDPARQKLLRPYLRYVAGLVAGGEALERRYYVLLPQPAGRGAADELRQRANDLAAALSRADLAARVLSDRELLDLLHSWSHPAQAAFERPPLGPPGPDYVPGGAPMSRFHVKSSPPSAAPALAPGLADLIAPAALDFQRHALTLGDQAGCVLAILDYPPRVPPAWLARLFSLPGVIGSLHLVPTDPADLVKRINSGISEFSARLVAGSRNAQYTMRTEQSLRDAQELLRKIDQEQQQVFVVMVLLLVLARDPDELDKRVRRVEAAAAAAAMRARKAMFLQQEGLLAAGPWAMLPDPLRPLAPRNMPSETIAGALPFVGGDVNDGSGILLGRDAQGGLAIVDIWKRGGDRTNSNWTVLAKPGGGKSFAVKVVLLRELAMGTRVIIIDPEREYKHICRELGGAWINCAGGGGRINPLQAWPIPPDPEAGAEPDDDMKALADARAQGALALHLQTLRTFFSLYLRDLTDLERAALQKALREVYARAGITWDTDPAAIPAEAWPTLRHLFDYVTARADAEPAAWARLAALLEEAVEGADAALWSGPTTVGSDADLIVLDVHELQNASDAVRRTQFFNVLAWAWHQIERDRQERTLLVVDEAWLLVDPQTPQALAFLRDTSKRIRKYGGGLVVISQNVVDFLDPAVARHGQALLDNPTYKLLLAQGEKDLEALSKLMNLSEAERDLLATAKRGEGLLVAGTNRVRLKIEAAPHELAIIDPAQARAIGAAD